MLEGLSECSSMMRSPFLRAVSKGSQVRPHFYDKDLLQVPKEDRQALNDATWRCVQT